MSLEETSAQVETQQRPAKRCQTPRARGRTRPHPAHRSLLLLDVIVLPAAAVRLLAIRLLTVPLLAVRLLAVLHSLVRTRMKLATFLGSELWQGAHP